MYQVKMRSQWINVGSKSSDLSPWKERSEDIDTTQRKDRVTMDSEVRAMQAESQKTPRSAGHHRNLRRGKENAFPRSFRRSLDLPKLRFQTFSLQNLERINNCCFMSKPFGLWSFVIAARAATHHASGIYFSLLVSETNWICEQLLKATKTDFNLVL